MPLPDSAVRILRAHKVEQNERRLILGEGWADHDLVIEDGTGRPRDPDVLTKAFHGAAETLGIAGVRLHDLRHAFASSQLEAGAEVTNVSRVLGHARASFTMDVYVHASPDRYAPIADAMEAKLGKVLGGL